MNLYEQSLFELIKTRLKPGFIDEWLQQQQPLSLNCLYFIIYSSLDALANQVCGLQSEEPKTVYRYEDAATISREFHTELQRMTLKNPLNCERQVYVTLCARRSPQKVIPICVYQVDVIQ